MEGLTFRQARQGDGDACARLWRDFGRALTERMPHLFREPEIEGLADWFESQIASGGPQILRAVAEIEGGIVGLAQAMIRPPMDPPGAALLQASLRTRVILEDLVVMTHARRQGIGEALLRYVESWGRSHQATVMQLSSDADGPARRFYERLGFTVDGASYSRSI